MKDADALCRASELEGRLRHRVLGPRFVERHRFEMFPLPHSEREEVYTFVPKGLDHESNFCLGVPTPVMDFYLADHFRMSGLKVQEHVGRIAKVENAFIKLGANLWTVCHEAVSWLAQDYMIRVCG